MKNCKKDLYWKSKIFKKPAIIKAKQILELNNAEIKKAYNSMIPEIILV